MINPAVGVSGSENSRSQMYVSQLLYQAGAQDSAQLLPAGTYTAMQSPVDNSQGNGVYSVNYTPSTQNYRIVKNVTFNNLDWTPGSTIGLVGVDREQIITFAHDDLNTTQRYLLVLQRSDGKSLNAFNANRLFFKSGTTSISIPQGALDADVSYCARIQAKNSLDENLRSETELMCFNTVTGTNPGSGSTAQIVDFNGTWNFSDTVTAADGVCTSDINTTTQYTVAIAQNASSVTATYDATTINGSVSGNQITLSGSVPDTGGTSTFTLVGTLNSGCITGTSNWTWTDGTDTCNNGVSDVRAALQGNPTACDAGTGGNPGGGGNPGSGGNPSNTPSTSGGGGGGGSLHWFWLLLLPFMLITRKKRPY